MKEFLYVKFFFVCVCAFVLQSCGFCGSYFLYFIFCSWKQIVSSGSASFPFIQFYNQYPLS